MIGQLFSLTREGKIKWEEVRSGIFTTDLGEFTINAKLSGNVVEFHILVDGKSRVTVSGVCRGDEFLRLVTQVIPNTEWTTVDLREALAQLCSKV